MTVIEVLNRTDSYLVSLAVLAVLAGRALRGDDRMTPQFRLFVAMLALTAIEIVLDVASLVMDGRPALRSWLTALYLAYFMIQPVTIYLWLLYAHFQVHFSVAALRRLALPAAVPLIVNAALVLSSPLTGWAFSLDGAGVYSRGSLFVAVTAVPFCYFIAIAALALRHWRRLPVRARTPLLLVGLPPAIGGAAQALLFGTSLLWPGVTVSLLMVYLGLESELIVTDHLTGLMNRRSLDLFLARKARNAAPGEPFAVAMLDLNGFKRINDRYGHDQGDEALKAAASVLRHCLHADDFIARYAGDEFVVVAGVRDRDGVETLLRRISGAFEAFNASSGRPWRLSASVGAALSVECGVPSPESGRALILEADRRMYADKRAAPAE